MTLKNILVASVLATVAAFGIGCGGNACEDAAEKCASEATEETAEENAEEVECTPKLECQANCFADNNCGKDAESLTKAGECAAACE